MAIRTNVSRYFSLRRILTQIHLNLFKIERHIKYDSLRKGSVGLFTTQQLKGKDFFHDTVVKF
jgi:hypothetical protein